MDRFTVPTTYWHELEDGRVQCDVCPRACKLRDGQRGVCFVRAREGNGVVLTTYGRSSGFCVDPIEKKPLNHFLPGTPVFSFGTAGCNLACRFCQNWDISKSKEVDTLADAAWPEGLAAAALELAAFARTKGWQGPSLRMLFVPGPVGYAAWLDSNRELANGGNVVGAIHLREIGGEGRWFLHRAGKQGSPFEEGLRASFRVTSGEFHDHSPRFDPLASGHNPIATERLADLSFPNLVLGRSGVETLVDASSHGAKSDITSDANFLAALLEQL